MSEVNIPSRSLSLILSQSDLTDTELLYIADAIYLAECGQHHSQAVECFQRHKKMGLNGSFVRALQQRNIDPDTATKVVTQTIDLLA